MAQILLRSSLASFQVDLPDISLSYLQSITDMGQLRGRSGPVAPCLTFAHGSHGGHVVPDPLSGTHSPSSCPSFWFFLIALLNDPAHSGFSTQSIYHPPLFPLLSHIWTFCSWCFFLPWSSLQHPSSWVTLANPSIQVCCLLLPVTSLLAIPWVQVQCTCSPVGAHRHLLMPPWCRLSHPVYLFYYIVSSKAGALLTWKISSI